ncbi:NAD-dependent epimerase/dehydratase family protein [Naasia aerilata]|uniref:dTDP-glucose 4,6-dehydratase n=1 Tax=Naasia aerilata TaxID=1162966 RepID=A0ABM8GGG8_9MICO|nr:NAD(P)-dependent oxidoreductase [Naasia aerilata]BDZ47450.1 dTDP-glucose 4,6-dehydratase [Naasia aerilata]
MKVLVAGASGAVGLPIVRRLVEQGHQVHGLVRGESGAERVSAQGATALRADVLDYEDVSRAVESAQPEVVIDQLTALPRHYSPQTMRDTLAPTNRVRVTGGANVQKAALRCGARRFLAQSGAYFYEPGPGLADESAGFVDGGPPLVAGNVAAFRAVEDRVASLPRKVSGLILRYGFFYGPGTWYSREGDVGEQARAGDLAVLGNGTGVWSFVHLEDAAEFTARAAVESDATGAVNVTDDDPLPVGDIFRAFAAHVGAAAPPSVAITEETDPNAVYYATCMRGASNRRARDEFGFRPRRLEWLDSSP